MPVTTIRQRRRVRARVAAERLGLCERTIRNYQAEYRSDYERRAAERRMTAYQLHALGQSWAEVGAAMHVSAEAARALAKRCREQVTREPAPQQDSDTLDMFREVRA